MVMGQTSLTLHGNLSEEQMGGLEEGEMGGVG